ncbi:MAG: CBS domain-containing protein, partial [Nitrospira sp.]|nr:CBS domain-containing protein [Nitrospira sp.]
LSPSLIVGPDVSVIQAMECMAQDGWDQLVVMQDGQIVGLVTQSAIANYMQLQKRNALFVNVSRGRQDTRDASGYHSARATEMF